jgi:Flp pilus assembly pilin Flp
LHRGHRSAAAVEYGLLAVLAAAVIVGLVATLGTDISCALQDVVTAF